MKSLHKVLDLIESVSEIGPAGISALATRTGLPVSTAHRIVSDLVSRRYLSQDPITKKYRLSVRFIEFGTKVQQGFDVVSIARSHLERLMEETRESVNLVTRDGDEVVYLVHIPSKYSRVQLFTRGGAIVPLYTTGVGKTILSQWPESEVEEYVKRTTRIQYTPNTMTERETLLAELARIRTQGYAVDNEELEMGVRCVAAPVFDHLGKAVYAISVSGTSRRITPDRIAELGAAVKSYALAISEELGFGTAKNVSPG
ncbi:MAG: IclR family transcriptional regulator [Deltaproteobacteria bacterium]|nr:IclR family transcriptional regulator [Deltaproteobacteria bacterium]